jgi:hypothetical protein
MVHSSLLRKVLLFSLFALGGQGQIVNIEQLRFRQDSSAWLFQDDLSFDIFKNTQEVIDIENQFLLRYQKARHQVLFSNGLHFNFSNQVDFAQSAYLHLRYVQRWNKWWEMEYFSQAQADRPLKIERRLLYGFGPRFGVDQKGDFQFHTGHLIMYEDDLERETGIRHFDWRLSSYVSLMWKFKDRFLWTSVTYYQPRFTDWSDWRMSMQNQLAFKLGEHWAFTVSAQLNYDARPVVDPQIPGLTYKIENGLQVRF